MDLKEEDIERKDNGHSLDPPVSKKNSYMTWLFVAAVICVIAFGIRFRYKSKPVAPSSPNPAPAIAHMSEPVNTYDLYNEIKKFMDKQTRYVMGSR